MNRNEGFNIIIYIYKNLVFIESSNSIASFFVFFVGAPFDFEINALHFLFLTWSFCGSFFPIFSPMVTSLLLLTFSSICDLVIFNFVLWNDCRLYKFLLANEDSCNPKCGWIRVIQAKILVPLGFWSHCYLARDLPLRTNKHYKIQYKKYPQKHTHILASSKNLELWIDGRDDPLSCLWIICLRNIDIRQKH